MQNCQGRHCDDIIDKVQQAVRHESVDMPSNSTTVKGYNFENGVDYNQILSSYARCGFQATNFATAKSEVNTMLSSKKDKLEELEYETKERRSGCTIFLGYTSNMISSGLRETFCFLAKHDLIDCIVTSAGGVEEDFIKCLAPTFLGDFSLKGAMLRQKGLNRIGNLLVPNKNYCLFQDWMLPILDQMLEEQKNGVLWTPSKFIDRLGAEINNEESVYYWAHKNRIPVFCPGLTDGSIGDVLYYHSYKNPGLVLDIIADVRRINDIAVKAHKTGMIILGGGLVKHHICNANLMRNGAEHAVFINTGQEFDGSDSGAKPDEAVSWGKIKLDAQPVKISCDATLIFPLLVAETFAKDYFSRITTKV